MFVHLTRMHLASHADEFEQCADLSAARCTPRQRAAARVHQALHRAGDEAVVDEEVSCTSRVGISPFEVAGAIPATDDAA